MNQNKSVTEVWNSIALDLISIEVDRKVLGEGMEILMALVPFEQTPYQRQWWTDEASRKYVKEEYQEMAYYSMRLPRTTAPAAQRRWHWPRTSTVNRNILAIVMTASI